MSNIWYTSDHHFSHTNVIKHENRPYDLVDEMDEALIEKWNKAVNKNDTVYHLGDVVFGGITKWEKVVLGKRSFPDLKGRFI